MATLFDQDFDLGQRGEGFSTKQLSPETGAACRFKEQFASPFIPSIIQKFIASAPSSSLTKFSRH
ncbi:hypothetical protein ABMC89_00005 [Sulfitobacter sp. HNIBRBA3233]|uniref:hypothetical protein n=1 Tax=Sulfitobacter marinivivus TaxID=3158558 RepID=UPI0032DE6F58